MTDNIREKKNQHNDVIGHELKFDNKFSLYSGSKYPLPVVTVILRIGKKKKATIISVLICLWDSRATDSMNKRGHTKQYEYRMPYNQLQCSTATGWY